jgi:hypothetical protein
MAPVTPYSTHLEDREPLGAMRRTVARVGALVSGWTPLQWERSYAPNKWSARQVLVHLAQTEIALGSRARLALTLPNYTSQSFEQDAWMAREAGLSGRDAADAFISLSRMNTAFFAGLSADDRQIPFTHPEYGALTVDWLIYQMAGHQIHHLKQLEAIS